MKYVFPFTIVALSFGASLVYLASGDWRQGVFRFAAGTINTLVTI
jgi:hypothetical protein